MQSLLPVTASTSLTSTTNTSNPAPSYSAIVKQSIPKSSHNHHMPPLPTASKPVELQQPVMSDSEIHRSNPTSTTNHPSQTTKPKQSSAQQARFNNNNNYQNKKINHPNANYHQNYNNYNRRRNQHQHQQQKPTKFYHANSTPLIGSVEYSSNKSATSPSKNHPTPVQPARFFYNSNNFRTTPTTTKKD